jgi:hypothetical protein
MSDLTLAQENSVRLAQRCARQAMSIQAVQRVHYSSFTDPNGLTLCHEDGQKYPCTTIRLLEME